MYNNEDNLDQAHARFKGVEAVHVIVKAEDLIEFGL